MGRPKESLLGRRCSLALSAMPATSAMRYAGPKRGDCVNDQRAADDDDEPREYSSPACYLHEFESPNRVDSASRIIHATPERFITPIWIRRR